MDAPYTSSELFHFVGFRSPKDHEANWRTLQLVLDGKCISHPPHDGTWGATGYTVDLQKRLDSEELLIPTVTCFADIPQEALGIHTRKYGAFGLSLSRSYLIQYGARPVIYIPMTPSDWAGPCGRTVLRDMEAIYKGFREHYDARIPRGASSRQIGKKPGSEDEVLRAVKAMIEKDFLAFLKPFNSELPENDIRNFYMEREWRKFGNLKFGYGDVVHVWVASGYGEVARKQYPELGAKVKELPPPH